MTDLRTALAKIATARRKRETCSNPGNCMIPQAHSDGETASEFAHRLQVIAGDVLAATPEPTLDADPDENVWKMLDTQAAWADQLSGEHAPHRGNHEGYACGFSGPHCWACGEPWPCRSERGVTDGPTLATTPEPTLDAEPTPLETAVSILLTTVDAVMPERSPYGCPHSRDWLNGLLDDVRRAAHLREDRAVTEFDLRVRDRMAALLVAALFAAYLVGGPS